MAAPNILCDTAGMTNAQWLAARMHGPSGKIPYTVGGSDVAAVFGVSPWTTPLELWMIKKGRMKPPAKSNANQLEMGHLLEPIAAHWYAKKTGNRVYEDTNLYQHADHPYALANFDRRFERASDGEPGILECKSCTYHKASEWDDGAIPVSYTHLSNPGKYSTCRIVLGRRRIRPLKNMPKIIADMSTTRKKSCLLYTSTKTESGKLPMRH